MEVKFTIKSKSGINKKRNLSREQVSFFVIRIALKIEEKLKFYLEQNDKHNELMKKHMELSASERNDLMKNIQIMYFRT